MLSRQPGTSLRAHRVPVLEVLAFSLKLQHFIPFSPKGSLTHVETFLLFSWISGDNFSVPDSYPSPGCRFPPAVPSFQSAVCQVQHSAFSFLTESIQAPIPSPGLHTLTLSGPRRSEATKIHPRAALWTAIELLRFCRSANKLLQSCCICWQCSHNTIKQDLSIIPLISLFLFLLVIVYSTCFMQPGVSRASRPFTVLLPCC